MNVLRAALFQRIRQDLAVFVGLRDDHVASVAATASFLLHYPASRLGFKDQIVVVVESVAEEHGRDANPVFE